MLEQKKSFQINASVYRQVSKYHKYVKKTEMLENDILAFPSIYIEGSASVGKTTAMKLLLQEHPEVEAFVFDVEKAEVLPRIKNRITQGAQDVLMQDIKGYTSVSPRARSTNLIRTNWHYTMLPVWFMTYKYNGKSYFFGMNGQTGKMVGKLPISVPKLAAFAAGLFVAVGIAAGLIGGGVL